MMAEESYCCESVPSVPPGFRFHPTEEELVGYYLARKVASQKMDLDIIQEVDLYRIEPWDLQERCSGNTYGEEQTTTEWYFFSYKDRKYPSGTRTNRATAAGFWKATGRDKPVVSRCGGRVIGMRKTLVFYRGRAPNGSKTDWIMHEYRLQDQSNHHHHQEEGWVVCRAFHKPTPNHRPFFPTSYDGAGADHHHHFLLGSSGNRGFFPQFYSDHLLLESNSKNRHLVSIPRLVESESPTADQACYDVAHRSTGNDEHHHQQGGGGGVTAAAAAAAIDWNFLDTLLSSHASLL